MILLRFGVISALGPSLAATSWPPILRGPCVPQFRLLFVIHTRKGTYGHALYFAHNIVIYCRRNQTPCLRAIMIHRLIASLRLRRDGTISPDFPNVFLQTNRGGLRRPNQCWTRSGLLVRTRLTRARGEGLRRRLRSA